jgi:hypothetical protein
VSSVPPFQPENASQRASHDDAPSSDGEQGRELWENVLHRTFPVPGDDDAPKVDEATWRELKSLAARHNGAPLTPEPILAEMIHIVLGGRFEQMIGSPRLLKELTAKIAKTLWDDPIAHGRVQTLWKGLSESPS